MKNFIVRLNTPLAFRPEERVQYIRRKRLGHSAITPDIAEAIRYDRNKAQEFAGRYNAMNPDSATRAEAVQAPEVTA